MSDVPNLPARPVLNSEAERMVSLREFEQRIFALERQSNDQLRAQRELLDTRSVALEKALGLQAIEYARRLEELNHAHARAAENWQRSLQREVFDGIMLEWGKWRDTMNTQVVTLSQAATRNDTRITQLEVAMRTAEGQLIVLNQQIAAKIALQDRMKKVEDQVIGYAQVVSDHKVMDAQLSTLQSEYQQFVGGIALVRYMGFAGVLGLVITFLRLMKVLP